MHHVVAKLVCVLPLTEENVELVLDEVRPSLMADGGNVALHEIDGLVVVLKLQGACGSCPSSTMTLKMGIETRLRDKIPEIEAVEQILDTETGLELNEENVEKVTCSFWPSALEYGTHHYFPASLIHFNGFYSLIRSPIHSSMYRLYGIYDAFYFYCIKKLDASELFKCIGKLTRNIFFTVSVDVCDA